MLFFACLTAAVLAAGATRLLVPWLARVGSIAHENARTMHNGSVPKGGGLALLAAAGVAMALVGTWPPLHVAVGVAILAALSWRDDLGHLPATVRLPVHLAISAWAVWSLPGDAFVFQGLLPFALDRVIATIALAWMTNLFNFMDGINGIAGAEVIVIAAGYVAVGVAASVALPFDVLAFTLAGAAAGFLVWNARETPLVFLGDVGSVPLGFLAGILMLDLAVRGFWPAALILPAYFLFDASATLLRRIWAGHKPWEAHKHHVYQRAAAGLGAHLPVVARITLANTALIAAAIFSAGQPAAGLLMAAAILAALIVNLERAARSRFSGSDPSRL